MQLNRGTLKKLKMTCSDGTIIMDNLRKILTTAQALHIYRWTWGKRQTQTKMGPLPNHRIAFWRSFTDIMQPSFKKTCRKEMCMVVRGDRFCRPSTSIVHHWTLSFWEYKCFGWGNFAPHGTLPARLCIDLSFGASILFLPIALSRRLIRTQAQSSCGRALWPKRLASRSRRRRISKPAASIPRDAS